MELNQIARIAHEVNRAYCEFLGDGTQPTWSDVPYWQKESCVAGVRFHIKNPEALPSASHDEWSKHKRADGWVYGEAKDPAAKTHPCLVAFEELPKEQQAKDWLFRGVVHACKNPA